MNLRLKFLLVAMAFGGSVATATASSVVTSVTASGPGLGSFLAEPAPSTFSYLSTAFSSVNPVTLTFTVAHSEGANLEHHVYESIKNGTATAFTSFHLHIDESVNVPGDGVVFNNFNPNDLYFVPDFTPEFTLDSPSKAQSAPFESTGSRDLNFTGELGAGEALAEDGYFSLTIPDPGAGNTYTFSVTQTPTVAVIPEPETYAMFLAGLGLMGFMARRKKQSA